MVTTESGRQGRLAVVHNPVKAEPDRLRQALADACSQAGMLPPLWFETTPEDTGQQVARQALDAGASLVVASGGDGTVRCVAEVLRNTDVPLAVAPQGTGNLLARNLDIPLNGIKDWVETIVNGSTRTIDMGVATITDSEGATSEHVFTVMAGLGLDAAMIANARPTLKKRVGWLAYADAAMRSAKKHLRIPLRFSLDGRDPYSARASMLLFGNCGMIQGDIPLLPNARPDDGILDIAVVQPRTLFDWLFVWRRIAWENRVLNRSAFGRRLVRLTGAVRSQNLLTYLRGTTIRAEVDTPQPFEVDGDSCGDVVAVECTIDPESLLVRVPREKAD